MRWERGRGRRGREDMVLEVKVGCEGKEKKRREKRRERERVSERGERERMRERP